MREMIARYWWAFALRGVFAVLFGLVALFWPGVTLAMLVLLFGIFALSEGILTIIAAISNRKEKDWWIVLIEGIAGVLVGIFTFAWPQITAVILLVLIAVWAVATGIMQIIAAVKLRKLIQGEWSLILSGMLSVLLGVVLLFRPAAGALTLIWVIGIYAIFFGALLVYLAFKTKRLAKV